MATETSATAPRALDLQPEMIEQFVKTFVIFFVVIEPVSLVPMFGALTRGGAPGYRRRMAWKSVAVSAGIFLVFALVGDWLLQNDWMARGKGSSVHGMPLLAHCAATAGVFCR